MDKIFWLSFLGGTFGLTITAYFLEAPNHSIAIEIARTFSVYLTGISLGVVMHYD